MTPNYSSRDERKQAAQNAAITAARTGVEYCPQSPDTPETNGEIEHVSNWALWLSCRKHGYTDESHAYGVPVAFAQRLERERDQLKARVVELEAWQPIETAPKDGTWILTYRPKEHGISIHETRWQKSFSGDKYQWGGVGSSFPENSQPTHWKPLPKPPTT